VTGRLVLVATPLGNLGDLTPRAGETLAHADVVCCEDTRRTGRLLQHIGVRAKRLIVVNEHTERAVAAEIVELVRAGQLVAVVTDAGLPGVSDPGEVLVGAAVAAGLTVSCVPGPSAGVAALVVSGLPAGRHVFEGFLPRQGSARRERIEAVAVEARTVVLYEAPHRLARTLGDLKTACGESRPVVLVRELTKLHEEIWRGTLASAVEHAAAVEPRGEYVVVLAGAAPAPTPTREQIADALGERLAQGADRKAAVADVARQLNVAKKVVYALSLERGS
jgi:16S rRNA (cytidine1402-2'-O)-methyltransferase